MSEELSSERRNDERSKSRSDSPKSGNNTTRQRSISSVKEDESPRMKKDVSLDSKRRKKSRSRSKSPGRTKKSRRRRSRSPRKDEKRRSRSRSPRRKKESSRRKRSRSPRKDDESTNRRKKSKSLEKNNDEVKNAAPVEEKKPDMLTRAGGAYIPPARLKMMMEQQADKSSEEYQRMNWNRLKKKIHGQVNKVNTDNIVQVVRELLQENVIRGKGLLANSIIQAQSFSPSFSHVYAALVSIINSKFPNIGELVIRRLVIQFKRAFRTNNKGTCVTVSTFIGHLANQRVCHELLVLQMLLLLMENPTDDSIEIAVTLLKVCGQMLTQVASQGLFAIFENLRKILEECDEISSRTQYMIEVLFAIRKEKFSAYPAVLEELDLIDEEDQVCHIVNLINEDGKPLDAELGLNIFKLDPDFEENEKKYDEIRNEIIGDADDSDEEEEGDDNEADDEGGNEENQEIQSTEADKSKGMVKIIDMTEQEKAAFRRNVYLTIQSSLDFQEAAHKLIKNMLKPGVEEELCNMIVDCCVQQRSYTAFYGKLAERFCKLRKEFQDSFETIAKDSYSVVHRFDMTKLRNLAMLIAHLLATDAISWQIFEVVKLTEEDTTSAGRIFIKIIFTQLCEHLGLIKLDERLHDATMYNAFEGLFPKDHPKNTRFAINFFSFIGLSGLTLDLRKHLKKKEKKMKLEPVENATSSESESSSSSSSSSDSESSSESSDTSSDESSTTSSTSSDDKIQEKDMERDVKPSKEFVEKIRKRAETEKRKDVSRSPRRNHRRKDDESPRRRDRRRSDDDYEDRRRRDYDRRDRRRDRELKSPKKEINEYYERPSRRGDRRKNRSRSPRRSDSEDERRVSRSSRRDMRSRSRSPRRDRRDDVDRRRRRSLSRSSMRDRRDDSNKKWKDDPPRRRNKDSDDERRGSPRSRRYSPRRRRSRSESPAKESESETSSTSSPTSSDDDRKSPEPKRRRRDD